MAQEYPIFTEEINEPDTEDEIGTKTDEITEEEEDVAPVEDSEIVENNDDEIAQNEIPVNGTRILQTNATEPITDDNDPVIEAEQVPDPVLIPSSDSTIWSIDSFQSNLFIRCTFGSDKTADCIEDTMPMMEYVFYCD